MKKMYLLILLSLLISPLAWCNNLHDYCVNSGGKVELMQVRFETRSGDFLGESKKFCTFMVDNGFIVIGLKAFASEKPSLAATFIKTLKPFGHNSSLWNGSTQSNPSLHVCLNLGGTSIRSITTGGFFNELGESDICVFGDGSMVSAWSLIYMANDREEYIDVKNKVRSTPLDLPFIF